MLNKVMLIGNLGQDPELKAVNDTHVCNMRIATNEIFSSNGEKKERTEWHNVIVWGKPAESCGKYLKKGRKVYVEGRIQSRQWTDKDKIDRMSYEIVADTVQFLDPKDK